MHGCLIMLSESVTCTWYFCHWMHSQHSIDLKNAVMERGNCEWCDLCVADNYRRSVVDRSTGQKVILSDEDIALASSLVKGKYSSPGYNPYEVNICIDGLWLCFLTMLSVNPLTPAVVITYARLHMVILLFQLRGRSDTVLAASPWQDHPPGILFQHQYAAAILYPHSIVIWKLNCLSERNTGTLVTVSSCKSGLT